MDTIQLLADRHGVIRSECYQAVEEVGHRRAVKAISSPPWKRISPWSDPSA
jgi:hypothetical protein